MWPCRSTRTPSRCAAATWGCRAAASRSTDVVGAEFAPRVTPRQWGGWGYRWRPEKGTAVVVRRGEGLVLPPRGRPHLHGHGGQRGGRGTGDQGPAAGRDRGRALTPEPLSRRLTVLPLLPHARWRRSACGAATARPSPASAPAQGAATGRSAPQNRPRRSRRPPCAPTGARPRAGRLVGRRDQGPGGAGARARRRPWRPKRFVSRWPTARPVADVIPVDPTRRPPTCDGPRPPGRIRPHVRGSGTP